MDEEMKEVFRVLLECLNELRKHDEDYKYVTNPLLKEKCLCLLEKHGIGTPKEAAELLYMPL